MEQEPLVEEEQTKKKKRSLGRSSTKQGKITPTAWKVWLCIIFLFCIIVFIFAVVDVWLQFCKATRTRSLALDSDFDTELLDDDDSNDVANDTKTIHSAAYIFAGPFNLPIYFFLGIVMAYMSGRSYNLRLYYANVKFRDVMLIFFTGLVALIYIIWRMVCEGNVRSTWNSINHISDLLDTDFDANDDLPDGEDVAEYDISYVVLWGSSPFAERSQYVYVALVFMLIFVLFKWTSFIFMYFYNAFPAARGDPFSQSWSRTGSTALNVGAANLGVSAVFLATFLLIIIGFQVSDTKYWLMFHATPFLVFAFILAGWCVYMFLTGAWWTKTLSTTENLDTLVLKNTEYRRQKELIEKQNEAEVDKEEKDLQDSNLPDVELEYKKAQLEEKRNRAIEEAEVYEFALKAPRRARQCALCSFCFTMTLALAATIFCIFQVASLFQDCSDDPQDQSSDLKQGVCQTIDIERHELTTLAQEKNTGTVCGWYNFFSIWLVISVIIQLLLVFFITIWVWCRTVPANGGRDKNRYQALPAFEGQERKFHTATNYKPKKQGLIQTAFSQRLRSKEKNK